MRPGPHLAAVVEEVEEVLHGVLRRVLPLVRGHGPRTASHQRGRDLRNTNSGHGDTQPMASGRENEENKNTENVL